MKIIDGKVYYEILLDRRRHQGTYSYQNFIEELIDLEENQNEIL